MADFNFTTRYGDLGSNVGNTTSTAVTGGTVKIAADTVYDFTAGRRTSSFLGKDATNVFALFEQAKIQWLDYQSNKTS